MEPRNIELLATVYGPATWDVYDKLDQSLLPSGPDELFDIAGAFLSPGSVVLDAGCRDAAHLVELVRRFDVTGIGVEPVPIHVERARTVVEGASLGNRVTIHEAVPVSRSKRPDRWAPSGGSMPRSGRSRSPPHCFG